MSASDRHQTRSSEPFGPATAVFPVAPADAVDLPYVTCGIYVGGAGDVCLCDPATGGAVIFRAVPAGVILPVRTARIRATGTTATSIVGLA